MQMRSYGIFDDDYYFLKRHMKNTRDKKKTNSFTAEKKSKSNILAVQQKSQNNRNNFDVLTDSTNVWVSSNEQRN